MSQENPLDNLIWNSLTSNHRHLGIIGEKAAIYDPQVSLLVGLKENTNEAWSELAELVPPGVPKAIGFKPPKNHQDWTLVREANANQMIIEKPITFKEMQFETLTASDVPQMMELMKLTEAAPFEQRTIAMGKYIGYKVDGKLVAMGGERAHPVGFVEISAIGTHPDFRRRGIGTAITGTLTNDIIERGEVPFLHVWAGNEPAFKCYKRLGYVTRIIAPVYFVMKPPR